MKRAPLLVTAAVSVVLVSASSTANAADTTKTTFLNATSARILPKASQAAARRRLGSRAKMPAADVDEAKGRIDWLCGSVPKEQREAGVFQGLSGLEKQDQRIIVEFTLARAARSLNRTHSKNFGELIANTRGALGLLDEFLFHTRRTLNTVSGLLHRDLPYTVHIADLFGDKHPFAFYLEPEAIAKTDYEDVLVYTAGMLQAATGAGEKWPKEALNWLKHAPTEQTAKNAHLMSLVILSSAVENAAVAESILDRRVVLEGQELKAASPARRSVTLIRSLHEKSRDLMTRAWESFAQYSLESDAGRGNFRYLMDPFLETIEDHRKQAFDRFAHPSEAIDNLERGTACAGVIHSALESVLEEHGRGTIANPLRGYRDQLGTLIDQFAAEKPLLLLARDADTKPTAGD